jgi:hypothetical protein
MQADSGSPVWLDQDCADSSDRKSNILLHARASASQAQLASQDVPRASTR